MNNDIDNLKKKILYRSTYRGTKEMDNLISSFVKSIINDLEYDDLKQLEKFLDIDDDNLLRFYNNIDLDRTDIFVSSIRLIVLESYDGGSGTAYVGQLSFDAIPSIDTHLEITNNEFGTVFNAYDKGAKGNIILNCKENMT